MGKLIILQKYGQAPIELLNDEKISFKAKGLFVFLQSKPDNWTFSIDRISKQTKEGRDGIRSAIQELEKAGYLRRIQIIADDTHRFIGYDYILSEKPITEQSDDGKTNVGKSDDYSNIDISNIDKSKKDISNIDIDKSTKKIFVQDFENSNPEKYNFLNKNQKRKKEKNSAKKEKKKTRLSSLELKNGWQDVWNDYLEWLHSQFRFRYKTEKSENIAFNKLYKISDGNIPKAKNIIKQSIENAWRGLFTVKESQKNKNHKTVSEIMRDEIFKNQNNETEEERKNISN